jgi:hypothetical protein
MTPQDLNDEMLTAVHAGADPLYYRHRPSYYTFVAKGIAGWTSATPSMLQQLVRDAQLKATRGAPADE